MSISPSFGQLKGSEGSNQKAGQIPCAQGREIVAERCPRAWVRRVRLTSLALVEEGPLWIARITSLLLGVL
jgi:hypothetical protein